jgi:CMP-N-acetylneuraminic acid synthetase
MEILAIIPVRGGSKGVPGKNIKLLAGKPLVSYTIDAAKNSKYITRTIVSTEDPKIKETVLSYGGAEVLDRPSELAQDETKTAPVCCKPRKNSKNKATNLILLFFYRLPAL